MRKVTQPIRGVISVLAEATDFKALSAELGKAFEDFKAAHGEEIKGINAKFDDVVSKEKTDKINDHVGKLQSELDAINSRLASASLNGDGDDRVKDDDYTKAFGAHMRKGVVEASLKEAPDSDGGYLAPVEWDRTIIDSIVETSAMRQIAGVQTISGQGFTKLVNKRGTASGWVGEVDTRPRTNTATFDPLAFPMGELYANPAITQRLLDDAEVNMESWLAGEVGLEFAKQEGVAFVSGDGVNKPKGLLADYSAHPLGKIAEAASGAAEGLTGDGLIDLVYDLSSQFTTNASFAMNRKTLGAVRKLKDGDGNYLWERSYQAGVPSTILGFGAYEMADMPDIAANAKAIAFGDFKQGYLVVDRSGTTILRDPYTNKPYVHFYTVKRVGGGVANSQALRLLKIAAA